jgi:hypothetical protein
MTTTRVEKAPISRADAKKESEVKSRFLDTKAKFLVDDITEALPNLDPEAVGEVNSHLDRALEEARDDMKKKEETKRIK